MKAIERVTPTSVRVVSVIEIVATRGAGVEGSPVRAVTQYWSDDGRLLAEDDPCARAVVDNDAVGPEVLS